MFFLGYVKFPDLFLHINESADPQYEDRRAQQKKKYPQVCNFLQYVQLNDGKTGAQDHHGGSEVRKEGPFICESGSFNCQKIPGNKLFHLFLS